MALFIKVTEICGSDWHDTSCRTKFLSEHGKLEIKNSMLTIANYIDESLLTPLRKNDYEYIATKEDVVQALKKGSGEIVLAQSKPVTYTDDDGEIKVDYENQYVFDVKAKKIEGYFMFGQFTDDYYIRKMYIDDDKVRYFAVENFLCPTKGVESVERMYSYPVTTQDEAEMLLKTMPLHENYESEKTILVDSVDSLLSSNWYAMQVIAINTKKKLEKTIKDYAYEPVEIPDCIYVDEHIKKMEELEQSICNNILEKTFGDVDKIAKAS